MGNTTTASPAVKLGPHARWGILAMLLSMTMIGCNYVSAGKMVITLMALAFFGLV